MKICYIPTLNLGTIMWRVENFAEEILKQAKHAVNIVYMSDPNTDVDWTKQIIGGGELAEELLGKLEGVATNYDVVIFQKLQNKEGYSLLMGLKQKFPKIKILMDIDDMVGEWQPSNINIERLENNDSWAVQCMKECHGVICSTRYLEKHLQKFNPNTVVIRNALQPILWGKQVIPKKSKNKVLRIGYVGAAAHDEDLKLLEKVFNAKNILGDKKYKFVIRYGGFRPDFLVGNKNVDFKNVDWHISEYGKKLESLKLDLALVPLRDTLMNRCKSHIKYLEWFSKGVPVIMSDTEAYHYTPYATKVPNEPEYWIRAIRKHLLNKNKRQQIKFKTAYNTPNISIEINKLIAFVKKIS